MASSQRLSHVDETPIAEFLRFLASNRSQGVRFGNSSKACTYVPQDELERYLLSPGRLQGLLESVCHKSFTSKDLAAVRTRLRVFSILVSIDRGSLIQHCVKVRALSDDRLPFESPPASFSSDTFKRFDEEQWAFCAHEFQDSDCDVQIHEDTILPICVHDKKGSGRTATASLVQIYPYYCFCATHTGDEDDSTNSLCKHEFIIKTYDWHNLLSADAYRNELNAFQTLGLNEEAFRHIVKFYGSFTQEESRNVILEYADQGTLEDYYQRIKNPMEEHDTTDFWEHFFNLARGLAQIHDVGHHDGESSSKFHGVHQDIKPSNILVFSNGETSPYRYTFKLADLGHSYFAVYDESGSEENHKVAVATRTYGPPDQYLERLVNSKFISAQRKGDVWSLAGVFSEAAGWVTYGPPAIEDYRDRRIKALAKVPGFKDGDCFHNGNGVLPEVESWHIHLAKLRRASDRVTPNIWQKLLQDCFKAHEQRLWAIQLLGRAEDLLDIQRTPTNLGGYYSTDNGKGNELTPSRPKRAHTHDASINSASVTHHPHDSIGTTSSGISYVQSTRKSGDNTETSASPSTMTSQGSPPPSRGFAPTRVISHPQNITQLSSGSGGNAEDEDTYLSQSTVEQPQWFSGNVLFDPPVAEPEADVANAMSYRGTDRSDGTIEYQRSDKPPCPVHERTSKVPKLSIDDVLQWRSRRKLKSQLRGKGNEKLEHHDYLNRVKGRDHIFLVDDALSMKPHWPDVINFFQALSYLTKTVDDDGLITLHFTVSSSTYRKSKSSSLLSKVQERGAQLSVTSNPETACDKILSEWKQKMNPGKLLNRVTSGGPSMSPVTLYILTDGVWEARSNLDGFVGDVVRFMDQNSMLRKHIGIQFIQFGRNPLGTARLAHLDNGLGLARDIVDTEPSTGNVLKVLLGPVDETFDAEEEIPAGAECTCARRERSN